MPAQRIEILFGKYLSKSLTDDERRELIRLVNHPEYKDIFIKLINEEFQSPDVQDISMLQSTITTEEILDKIMKQTGKKKTSSYRLLKFVPGRKIKYSVAAVLTCCLLSGVIYKIIEKNKGNERESLALYNEPPKDIPPAKNSAILTLANGQKILLGDDSSQVVVKQGNLRVVKGGNVKNILSDSLHITEAVLSTARANLYNMVLPDGSKVWLNSLSSIKFPNVFTGKERVVTVTGEAYFEVKKDPQHPFTVKVNETAVKVLGTHFNVDAYDDKNISTTLLEGSVKVTSKGRDALIKPGETAVSSDDDIKVVKADMNKSMAWKNNEFYFENDPLPVIMEQISRWYDVDIKYNGKPTAGRIYTGSISRNVNLSEALKMLHIVSHADYETDGRTVIVKLK